MVGERFARVLQNLFDAYSVSEDLNDGRNELVQDLDFLRGRLA
jgi:hypothetical protein